MGREFFSLFLHLEGVTRIFAIQGVLSIMFNLSMEVFLCVVW